MSVFILKTEDEKEKERILYSSVYIALENRRNATKHEHKRVDFRYKLLEATPFPLEIINLIIDNLFSLCLNCKADNFCFELDPRDLDFFKMKNIYPYCTSCDVCDVTCTKCTHISHLSLCTKCKKWICRSKSRLPKNHIKCYHIRMSRYPET